MNPSSYLADVCNSLGHNLHRIGQLTREETNKVLKPYDLTPEQWQMLAVLYKTNGVTPTELGRLPYVTKRLSPAFCQVYLKRDLFIRKHIPKIPVVMWLN
ncbi:MarR family winged helix-turn-helix transcriptional regulator [Brevibacillus laterosporus]